MTRWVRSSSLLSSSLASVLLVACGGSDGASFFPDPGADAGVTPTYDAGTFGGGADANDGAPSVPCTPAALPASFKTTWHPPNGASQDVCTAQQMSDFFDDCLTPPINAQTCTSYVSANSACASCLQSEESAPTYGPVIWHSNDAFFTLNIPGCLAIVENDTSATSCGAAYQAVLECKEGACTQCFSSSDSSFEPFANCENEASAECNSYQNALNTTCAPDELHDANAASAVCIPPATTATKDVYLTFAPLFCGH